MALVSGCIDDAFGQGAPHASLRRADQPDFATL
jgi:hypothetical protein